jgi:transcriptional regulator with XRE-family HTH domain
MAAGNARIATPLFSKRATRCNFLRALTFAPNTMFFVRQSAIRKRKTQFEEKLKCTVRHRLYRHVGRLMCFTHAPSYRSLGIPLQYVIVSPLQFVGYYGIPIGMKKNFSGRLRVLRDEIGITQLALAKRAGLSLPYIKKLERGKKPMSKRPAVAIAIATGADWRWLAGEGKTYPIAATLGMAESEINSAQMAGNQKPFSEALRGVLKKKGLLEQELEYAKKAKPFSKETRTLLANGVPWKKEMADAIQRHKENPKTDDAEKMEQKLYRLRHHIFCVQLSQIIQAAMNQKRAELVVARIEDFIRELAAEPWLKLFKPAKPPPR